MEPKSIYLALFFRPETKENTKNFHFAYIYFCSFVQGILIVDKIPRICFSCEILKLACCSWNWSKCWNLFLSYVQIWNYAAHFWLCVLECFLDFVSWICGWSAILQCTGCTEWAQVPCSNGVNSERWSSWGWEEEAHYFQVLGHRNFTGSPMLEAYPHSGEWHHYLRPVIAWVLALVLLYRLVDSRLGLMNLVRTV